ncbi:Cof-type HAD-IIB family hydrolase [Corynebacterium poyangense]|uniref:Cof-type HAD-IIB family hydrolase n=1 Tax=Corynebacterium poyangense TaxID=2684405 RepID=A0A7H0SRR3_9CORY|nr:HAD family hydrolase [Corynebacterium poyangense]MBZ8176672.1 Cof-type HAD-IIB family hydrolase [Corynebacterium poyangense]QNQ91238.1 Cof-type HAD-IIB family hydrolase [Corynebacterium poyangense]
MKKQPLLVASDIDGTLINSQDRVLPRVYDVIERAAEAGTEIALATGRPHRWIEPVLEQLPIRPVCVCANGAVLYDSKYHRIVRAHELSPEALSQVVSAAREALAPYGGVKVAVERAGTGDAFDDDPRELFVVTPGYFHLWGNREFGEQREERALSQPAIKLLLRNTDLQAAEMYRLVQPAVDPKLAHVTYSMDAGILEVAAPGVNKAHGVAELARMHKVPQQRVLSFGDMPNDIEMLRWAGWGVAMAGAREEVKAAADEITTSHDDGGVADVLERWF